VIVLRSRRAIGPQQVRLGAVRWLAVVVLGAAALAGCGGQAAAPGTPAGQAASSDPSGSAGAGDTSPSDSAQPAAASLPDSCTLLTAADLDAVTKALGGTPDGGAVRTTAKKTDVGPAVEQHSTCHYVRDGAGGMQFDLDVMTQAEYDTLDDFETPKPIAGLGDAAAVYGVRPAVRVGALGALIANTQGTTDQAIELLKIVATKL
jgi:hypothetical protein